MELILNGGFTDAKYSELTIPKDGQPVNYAGNKQIFTPAYTTLAVAQYTYPVSQETKLVARMEARLFGKQYFDLANAISQDAYGLLNARAGISWKKTELFLWARNLTNATYISYGYDFGGVHLGNPRTYGATISVKL